MTVQSFVRHRLSNLRSTGQIVKHTPRYNFTSARGSSIRLSPRLKLKTKSKLMTKGKKLNQVVVHDGPVSKSFFAFSLGKPQHPPKGYKMITGDQVYMNNDKLRLTHNINLQNATGFGAHFSGLDCNQILLNAYNYTAGAANHTNYKVFMEQCRVQIMATNQTSDVVKISFYDIVPRKDMTSSVMSPPINAWSQGTVYSGASASSITYVGASPFHASAFTKLWKVQKITTVNLHTGGHHIHNVLLRPRKMFDIGSNTELGNNSYSAMKGFSGFTMMVQHGFPVNDGTTVTNVGTANGAVDYTCVRAYRYRIFQNSISDINLQASAFSSIGTAGIINDLTGAGQGIVTA